MKKMTKNLALVLFAVIGIVFCNIISAQPIKSPYPFVQSGSDTLRSALLPVPPAPVPDARIVASGGHFLVNFKDKKPERVRFFGTELDWTSQFMSSMDARILAKRLHKLGFNAIRLTNNDFAYPAYSWTPASFFNNANKTTSYNLIASQLARFDTLLYEFKKQGIYAFLVLNSSHYYLPGDGVAQWDTIHGNGAMVHFIDNRAAELHREWAKTILSHVNPLTGLKLADDPVLAGVEVASSGVSLLAGWRFGYLNWIDEKNVLTKGGAYTIGWNRSRRLDTLFSQYLLHKYGSDAGISKAWSGGAITNAPNVIGNGSFEQIGSTAWSFNLQNGATGDKIISSPGIDSQYCMLTVISGLSTKPTWSDAYLQNSTARLGKDSLYELSFYSKIHFDKANPVLSRPILVYLAQYQSGAASVTTYQTIDTAWKKYSYTFRAAAGGLQLLYLGVGQQLGDVLFDAVSIKRKEESGLFPSEMSSASSIVRIKYGETDMLPRQRVRDLALFYDSLQNDYFSTMKKCIADTIKSSVLVNFYAPEWWGTPQDAYANRSSDFAQAHINTDYNHARTGGPAYSDSTWVMFNNSILGDLYNNSMGYVASQSIEGKPFIGRFMNLSPNQYSQSIVPFYTSYASLQDWDGFFFSNYATYYEDLFASASRNGSFWSIAGNPSLLIQMPVASDAFRNERIKASPTKVIVSHDADDILLKSLPSALPLSYSSTGPMGTEGYLQLNIATLYRIRQQFDAARHKVAAEYPYLFDTITKVSETNEISWSQTGGYLMTDASGFSAAVGIFGIDTIINGALKFRRLDNAADMESILLTQLPNSTKLLTIASRSQNFGAVWQYGDSSIGNKWGKLPTIMSAGKFEFFFTSDSNRLIAHPLDESGNLMSGDIEGIKISGTNTFKFAIDQSVIGTPWFNIEGKNSAASVSVDGLNISDVTVFPNPAQNEAHIKLSLANSGVIKISLYDDLGREAASIANGELYQGSYDLPLDLRALPAGHYTLRVDCGANVMSKSVSVVK